MVDRGEDEDTAIQGDVGTPITPASVLQVQPGDAQSSPSTTADALFASADTRPPKWEFDPFIMGPSINTAPTGDEREERATLADSGPSCSDSRATFDLQTMEAFVADALKQPCTMEATPSSSNPYEVLQLGEKALQRSGSLTPEIQLAICLSLQDEAQRQKDVNGEWAVRLIRNQCCEALSPLCTIWTRTKAAAANCLKQKAGLDHSNSMDMELLQGILASLEPDAGASTPPAKSKLLRHISGVDREVLEMVLSERQAQIRPAGCGASSDIGMELGVALVLPSLRGLTTDARKMLIHSLFDEDLRRKATACQAINTSNDCSQQYVVNTDGDGNCLAHACSLGVWGIHDSDLALRKALAITMEDAKSGAEVWRRFQAQLAAHGIPEEEWSKEWERERHVLSVEARFIADKFLGDVHCFLLANVLRRPVIVYGPEVARESGLAGIYLPLLCEDPSAASRLPVSVLFFQGHYSLLAVIQGEGPSPHLLPLFDGQGALPLRFLAPEENNPETAWQLMCTWMDFVELPNGGLGARLLDDEAQPSSLVRLMQLSYVRRIGEDARRCEEARRIVEDLPGKEPLGTST